MLRALVTEIKVRRWALWGILPPTSTCISLPLRFRVVQNIDWLIPWLIYYWYFRWYLFLDCLSQIIFARFFRAYFKRPFSPLWSLATAALLLYVYCVSILPCYLTLLVTYQQVSLLAGAFPLKGAINSVQRHIPFTSASNGHFWIKIDNIDRYKLTDR